MKQTYADKILFVLRDGKPHTITDLLQKCYRGAVSGGSRVKTQVRVLIKQGYQIAIETDDNTQQTVWYTLTGEPPKKRKQVPVIVMRDGRPVAVFSPDSSVTETTA